MVAIIKTGYSLRRAFHYNENKVEQDVAKLLLAQNYPMDADRMTTEQRIAMLVNTAAMSNVKRNSVHISLNFAPGEVLEESKLIAIADEYMQRIGFGNQPYLVYQHFDAAHPHLHIVTTNVQQNRRGIRTQNIAKLRSEPARLAIEKQYGLIAADDHKRGVFTLPPLDVHTLIYGKSETKRGITTVLDRVLMAYKYTCLGELNAVLNTYNVQVDRGGEDSKTYTKKGLYYRLIDHDGNRVGAPLKASLFHQRPTLAFLEKRFLLNHSLRRPHMVRAKNAIDLAFRSARIVDLLQLEKILQRSGIKMVSRLTEEGRLYGITFIDHTTKCVFNGSILGKEYSAGGIAQRLQPMVGSGGPAVVQPNVFPSSTSTENQSADLLEMLMQAEQGVDYVPYHLRFKKKRRKKKNINPNQ